MRQQRILPIIARPVVISHLGTLLLALPALGTAAEHRGNRAEARTIMQVKAAPWTGR
jgi:hypothetical protein